MYLFACTKFDEPLVQIYLRYTVSTALLLDVWCDLAPGDQALFLGVLTVKDQQSPTRAKLSTGNWPLISP